MFAYEAEAALTHSNEFYAKNVVSGQLIDAVSACIDAAAKLDIIKKSLFYNKPLPLSMQIETEEFDCNHLPNLFHNRAQGINVIHAILGIATEAGELLEALLSVIYDNRCFDQVNAVEECGDIFWYQALLVKACDSNFEKVQAKNIAKLRKRYPNQFTAFDANNRDLIEERKVLEDSQLDFEF